MLNITLRYCNAESITFFVYYDVIKNKFIVLFIRTQYCSVYVIYVYCSLYKSNTLIMSIIYCMQVSIFFSLKVSVIFTLLGRRVLCDFIVYTLTRFLFISIYLFNILVGRRRRPVRNRSGMNK